MKEHMAMQPSAKQTKKLPKSLQLMSSVAIVGMITICVASGSLSVGIVREWPSFVDYLWNMTPSLRHLQMSDMSADEQLRLTAETVTVLYGMLLWGSLCVVTSTAWSLIAVPGVTFENKPGLEQWRIVALCGFMILMVMAIVFFGLYPLRSESFLMRGGLLHSATFWWVRAFLLISGCTVGTMCGLYAIVVVVKSRKG
jgi:hypothetical protein